MTVEELEKYRSKTKKGLTALKSSTLLRQKNLPVINLDTFAPVDFDNLQGTYALLSKTLGIQERVLTFYEETIQKFKSEGLDKIKSEGLDKIKCPVKSELSNYLVKREAIVNTLETLATTIKIINLPLLTSITVINSTEKLIFTITTLKTFYSTALAVIPVAPGITTSVLATLDDLLTNLKFTQVGESRVLKLKNRIGNISKILQLIQKIVGTTVKYLQNVDKLLIQCGEEVTDLSPNLKEIILSEKVNLLSNTLTNSYNGFTFKIETKTYSKHLDYKVGQALNSENIVVLETEPSFTDNPEVLVEELKFIIDRDNLKAY